MFRYERPQKGRFRQFHQIGAELLGPGVPQADVEVIGLGAHILEELGLTEKTVLELNSLGDSESRSRYDDVLVSYFRDHEAALSQDSKVRLARNPLRILDSKDEGDRKIVAKAPTFEDSFNPASTDFFAEVCAGLDRLGIAYKVNRRLVRGLDYYCHTAFEFTTNEQELVPSDYVVASGVLNVKLDASVAEWEGYVVETLDALHSLSLKGFAFNALTSYSDPEHMRDDLFYADPSWLFDHCKRTYSGQVALLHDYGLYEFTILVRKDLEASLR